MIPKPKKATRILNLPIYEKYWQDDNQRLETTGATGVKAFPYEF